MNPDRPALHDDGFVTIVILALLLASTTLLLGLIVSLDLVIAKQKSAQVADAIALGVLTDADCQMVSAQLLETRQQLAICEVSDESFVTVVGVPKLKITQRLFPTVESSARAGLELIN